jgi:hypothetical protein
MLYSTDWLATLTSSTCRAAWHPCTCKTTRSLARRSFTLPRTPWTGATQADPLSLEALRERFLPECNFRGRQNSKLRYAVLAAAAVHGGAEPDLLEEFATWRADGFWQYAMYAAVAYIRAAASRKGVPVHRACQALKELPGYSMP